MYGLGGGVWTADPERAMRIARQVRTGFFTAIPSSAILVRSPVGAGDGIVGAELVGRGRWQ
jgi:acyl-CoA reductase-like NAD-dependent aldehyde dehydrogenase